MAFSVMRSSRGLVQPSEPTPKGTIDLSAIDKLLVLRCNARTLHVFREGVEAAKVIRKALSRALVPYYPLAGQLCESSLGELQIACTGEGVWFVEASTDCTLASVNYFDDTASIPYDELLPDQDSEMAGREPLVQMQVTHFACGGFVMGLIFCHSICDGLGAAQFLNAVGELARGLDKLRVAPVWNRDFFPSSNAKVLPSHPLGPPPVPEYELEHANIDVPIDEINLLKREFQHLTGKACSTFEIVAATLWRNRTRAIQFEDSTEVTLVFFANCRHLLQPPLPEGFYGNCFFPVTVKAHNEFLVKASSTEVVQMIKDAKAKLPDEFAKYLTGQHAKEGIDPFAPPLTYTTLFISEWGRLGFNQVDYGWGKPVHIVPIQGSSIIPVSIVGFLPLPRRGIRLMTWCTGSAHLGAFLDRMTKLT